MHATLATEIYLSAKNKTLATEIYLPAKKKMMKISTAITLVVMVCCLEVALGYPRYAYRGQPDPKFLEDGEKLDYFGNNNRVKIGRGDGDIRISDSEGVV